MKNALIIFVRNPVLGKVKTRLARTLGNEKALLVYRQLLNHTTSITSNLNCDKYVYYSDFTDESDGWNNAVYKKKVQQGSDLGERMKNAFNETLNEGYSGVVIIGSDCYQLTTSIIESAFEKLEQYDAVIGPSEDGGYYLLGLKTGREDLFEKKAWSTSTVFTETIRQLEASRWSYALLTALKDIDVEEDLPATILF